MNRPLPGWARPIRHEGSCIGRIGVRHGKVTAWCRDNRWIGEFPDTRSAIKALRAAAILRGARAS